jgi:hypothetical protein
MSELYLPVIEKALGERTEDIGVQEVIRDATTLTIPANHPEQHPVRRHLHVLKQRRDRDIRAYIKNVCQQDENKALVMELSATIQDRKVQCVFNKEFMQSLSESDPEFRAIFSYYDHLRRCVHVGAYFPADVPTDGGQH